MSPQFPNEPQPRPGAIVVFGGAGFIGGHLLRRLQRTSDSRPIYSVDIRRPKQPLDGIIYLEGDVRDLSTLQIEGPIVRIYNLSAVHTTPGHPPHQYYETNIGGATEVAAFARRHNVQSIFFTSSISVYGPSEETKSEASTPTPESAYGWSKWLAEGIHRSWLAEDPTRQLVICRPAVIFGPDENGNFTRLARLMKKGFFIYPGRKDTIKACFYVGDLVDAIEYALSRNERYILFNGCYPDRYTLQQIVDEFRQQYFSGVRTYLLPKGLVVALAGALQSVSAAGFGVHPDRVRKLLRSTDIEPNWLKERGFAQLGKLPSAIRRWHDESSGSFQ